MPAVEIEKLSTQVSLVAAKFGNPQELMVSLRALFESYADRTFRPGTTRRMSVLLPEYHLSPVIMRLLERELGRYCEANPLATLQLIDLLWKEPFKEPRLLASNLLGRVPSNHSDQVIRRLLNWCESISDSTFIETIVSNGSLTLRTRAQNPWMEIIQKWLISPKMLEKSLGLTSLLPLIQDRSFENLPQIYEMIAPMLKKVDPSLMSILQAVIENLARRSPNETVFILKQIVSSSQDQNLFRLLRRCLPSFPEESLLSLRAALTVSPPTPF